MAFPSRFYCMALELFLSHDVASGSDIDIITPRRDVM